MRRTQRNAAVAINYDEPSTSQASHSESLHGKIKSVYCKNFVTYAECIFHPSEYLNVIIGPNGTGKSTLVAAIVLGLGGKPELLSRSNSIGDYVKNGRVEAIVRVEIYREKHGKTRFFQRRFQRTGKSEYQVDEEVLSERNFLSAVAQFQIQIGNLCQFLPQDKVQDFAKMDPQTIFVNTIKSVCSQEVVENYDKLRQLRSSQLNESEDIKKHHKRLLTLQDELEKMQSELQLFREQQDFRNQLDVCEAKKLQLEAKVIKKNMEQLVADLKLAERKLNEEKQKEQEIRHKQADIIRAVETLKQDVNGKGRIETALAAKITEIEDRIKVLKNDIQEARTNYKLKEREKASFDRELQKESNVLQMLAQDLTNAKSKLASNTNMGKEFTELNQEIGKLKDRFQYLIRERTMINSELDDHTPEVEVLKRRIQQANNIKERKLQYIREKFPDAYKAVMWLQNNRDMFEGHIYNPILLEVNIRNQDYAKYFENTISVRDLQSFVCENKADMSLLVNELRVNQGLAVNVAHAPPAERVTYTPDVPISNLKHLGFVAYLIELIEGPPTILNYLCSLNALHRIPVGTNEVNRHTDSVPPNIQVYFGGDQCYSATISRYSKERSVMQNHIRTKKILDSIDANEINRNQQRLNELFRKTDALNNKRSSIEAKIAEINAQREEVVKKKRSIEEKFAVISQLEEKCKRQKDKVANLKDSAISLPELEQQFDSAVQKNLQAIMTLQLEKINVLDKYQKAMTDKKCAAMRARIFEIETSRHKSEIDNAADKVRETQKLYETVLRSLDTIKREFETKKQEALNAKRNCRSLELLNGLPNDLEELQDKINDYRGRLECMNGVNQEILTTFEQKSAEIERLKKSIEKGQSGNQNIAAEMGSIHEKWFPEIDRIVQTLNTHFGDFMSNMDYVGEIKLVRTDENDYQSYGIQILVQYRKNVPLQALNRHVQSGGERAVAIATYTLSLQHITHVPFRCVDEINQGMDPRNERKIFKMLVDETTKPGRSQYFFITPKLLPNLSHNERMTVHIVFNGKMIQYMDVFDAKI